MGLDMYLRKTKRVKGITVEQYDGIDDVLPSTIQEFRKSGGLEKLCPELKNASKLDICVREKGVHYKYLSLFEEVGYWRKANHIHSWFVQNCQGGIDECQLTEVSKEQLEKLLVDCIDILNNSDNILIAKETLPTQSGFFFGGTEYDEYYFNDVRNTIDILKTTLETTDFEEEIVFYRSSW